MKEKNEFEASGNFWILINKSLHCEIINIIGFFFSQYPRIITVQIDIPADQEYLITGGALPGIYKMDQMHFHWASEHTIDNKR